MQYYIVLKSELSVTQDLKVPVVTQGPEDALTLSKVFPRLKIQPKLSYNRRRVGLKAFVIIIVLSSETLQPWIQRYTFPSNERLAELATCKVYDSG